MKKYFSLFTMCGGLLLALLSGFTASAQLCSGSLGDPVVNITFGAGSNPGPPLSSNLTNISYISSDCPSDGSYTIRNNTGGCFGNTWFNINRDHTGDPNGYFMLVNASFQPSDFYVVKIDGLCTNTTYEFASWVLNILRNPYGIKPNLTFQIEKTNGTILQTYNTGDISVSASPEWKQFGFFFQTTADASSVIVRIRNNAPGGNGNDLALDDITFRPCGPTVTAAISGLVDDSTSVCEGTSVPINLTGEVLAGYANPTYQWQLNLNDGTGFKDIPSASGGTLQVNPSFAGRYTYRLSVAESGNLGVATCRVNSNEVNVYVRGKPTIAFDPVSATCHYDAVQLKANVGYQSPIGWIASWTAPNIGNAGTESLVTDEANQTAVSTFSFLPTSVADGGFYQLRVGNLYGCVTVDSLKLSIKEKPAASFTTNSAFCQDVLLGFNGAGTIPSPNTISKYSWDFGNGSRSSAQNASTSYATPGSYNVSYQVAASNGCLSDTIRKQIVVHASPVVDFKLPEVCLADPYAEFVNSSTINDPASPALQYAWTFGDPSGNNNSSVTINPRHTYSSVGQYNVSLRATSSFGCIADTMKVFTVNGSVPKSNFRLNSTGLLCSRDSVFVINESVVDFGNITRLEIYWDYDRDPTIKTIDEDPVVGRRYGHLFNNTGLAGTNYRVRYVVYSGINCVNQSEDVLSIKKSPELEFDAVLPVCQDVAPFQLVQAREVSGIAGSGQYSGNGVNGSRLFTPSNATDGDNLITYTFTSFDGCSTSLQQVVTVYPLPVIDAGPDRTVLKGGQIQLQASGSGINLRFNWSPSSTVLDPGILKATVKPTIETLYTLIAISEQNCRSTDDVLVKVVEFIAVPNAFTPNGDGKNDTWQIPYIESFPTFEVRVFNRYGQLVYQSKNAVVNWDGALGGKPQDAGTYVYIFDRKQFGGITRGTILLIR